MHIHKITSTSQEHQSFLAQNRKDPITGDSILENDEVVFCAGCKSVFLKDTWEYLGKQHCEQSETLVEFPINFESIYLKTEEKLLFYSYLSSYKGFTDSIPSIDRSIWKFRGLLTQTESQEISNDLFYLIVLIGVIAGIGAVFLFKNALFIIFIILFLGFIFLLKTFISNKNNKKVVTFHENFGDTVFYISDKKIGFSTSFGREDYASDFSSISSLFFDFSQFSAFSSLSSDCVIEDVNKKRVRFRLNYFEIQQNDSFLETLDFLNKHYFIEINIITNSIKNKREIERFIELKKSNLIFSFVD